MPRYRCNLIGDGDKAGPFRVELPSYALLDCDYKARKATVELTEAEAAALTPAQLAQAGARKVKS